MDTWEVSSRDKSTSFLEDETLWNIVKGSISQMMPYNRTFQQRFNSVSSLRNLAISSCACVNSGKTLLGHYQVLYFQKDVQESVFVLSRVTYTGEAIVTGDNIQYYLTGCHKAGITSIGDPYVGICVIMFNIDTGQALVTSNCVRNHNSTQHLH